jgi:CitMHS family citrate-Mg2+:H+ or citrate-Ca2+:H+ symporter
MAIALKIDVSDIVLPMLPAFCLSLAGTLAIAYVLGRGERRRLNAAAASASGAASAPAPAGAPDAGAGTGTGAGGKADADATTGTKVAAQARLGTHAPRKVIEPRNFWFNLPLTLALMVSLAIGYMPLPALVMIAFALAITVNFPDLREQQDRLKPHAGTVVMLATLILSAGAFTGIINESGMVKAMSDSIISVVPHGWGGSFAFVTALLSMPLLIILSTDSFFLGVVPVLAHTAGAFGVPPAVIARAALIGMPMHSLSPLIAPIYFVATLLRTDIGSLQRFAWRWSLGVSAIALLAATVTGAVYAA